MSSYAFGYISPEKIYSSQSWMGMVLQGNEVFYSLEPSQMDLNTVCTYNIPDSEPIRLYTVSVKKTQRFIKALLLLFSPLWYHFGQCQHFLIGVLSF